MSLVVKRYCGRWLGALALAVMVPTAQAACSVSTSSVAFGTYNPLSGSPNDSTGSVTVNCSFLLALALSYTISFSAGSYGSYATRKMASGTSRLNYNLYTDLLRSQVWGDGSAGTSTVPGGSLIALLVYSQIHPVYGRIPSGQAVSSGSYADSITVTLTY